jgi:hypothetical protein
MATVYRCKKCGIGIPRSEERQRHLHWHQIMDRNIDDHFTEEQVDDAPPATAPGVSAGQSSGRSAKAYVVVAIALIAAVVAAAVMMKGSS